MIEGRDRKNPGWIAELDKIYNGVGNMKPNTKNSRELKKLYQQRKKLIENAPQRPKGK